MGVTPSYIGETVTRVARRLSYRHGLEVAHDSTTATPGELDSDVYFEISRRDKIPSIQPIYSDGLVSDSINNQ
eukprot:10127775-Prorocentrum_lima.AAC.1